MEDGSSIRYFLSTITPPDTSIAALLLDLLILAFLILINAFFSASEIAIISLNDNMIRKKAEDGDKAYRKIAKLIAEPSAFLATIQVGVTLAGFLASAFAADKFAQRLQALIGIESQAIYNVSVVVVTIILSYFSLVFGELVPKRVAQNNPEKFAKSVAGIIAGVGIVMRPFVMFLTFSTNLVLRLLGVKPGKNDRSVTEEEIRMMVDVGRESGNIHAAEKEMIENIFEFNDKEVSEIMTHRTNVVSLDVDAGFDEVLQVAIYEKYTRIPVYEESIDNIIGVLHTKDLLIHAAEGPKQPFSLRSMLRAPYFVPESKDVDTLFREMQRDRAQLAVVIDEYGGTAGIITLEDLLEEIVGNLQDEYDEEELEIVQKDKQTYLIAGMTQLDEVGEALGIEFPDEDYDTLAGLFISLLDRIPEENEQPEVAFRNMRLKVLEMDEKRVSRILLTIIPDEAAEREAHE